MHSRASFVLYGLLVVSASRAALFDWQSVTPTGTGPGSLSSGSSVLASQTWLMFGGSPANRTQIAYLDLSSLAWGAITPAGSTTSLTTGHLSALYAPSSSVLVAGFSALASRRYNPATQSYSAAADMILPQQHAGVAVLGAVAYAFGGVEQGNPAVPISWFKRYSFNTNEWATVAQVADVAWPPARRGHTMVAYGRNLYVFGGLGGGRSVMRDFWSFNVDTERWALLNASSGSSAPPARHGHSACVCNGRMWVFGGVNDSDASSIVLYNDVWYYDFLQAQWVQVPQTVVHPAPRGGSFMTTYGDYLYVYGGTGLSTYSDLWSLQLTKEGPAIVGFWADDPDDLDAIYGYGDTLNVLFNMDTNTVPVATMAEVLSYFAFSPADPAYDFSGYWANASHLVIRIIDPLVSGPSIGGLTVSVIGNVRDASLNTKPSRSVSGPLTGDWGLLPGPAITRVNASDPDNLDIWRSAGDVIEIAFDKSTNRPFYPSPTQTQLLSVFSFSQSLGTRFSGIWISDRLLSITMENVSGAVADIGSLTVSVIGPLYNFANTSLPSRSSFSYLGGNWGARFGPYVLTATAGDPLNDDAIFDNGDTITMVFSEPTNRPLVSSTTDIDALMTCTAGLGTTYTGVWVDALTLRITISDVTGGSPTINSTKCSFLTPGNLRDSGSNSFPSVSTTPALRGNWGTLPGPNIVSFVADDPDDLDAVFGDGDVLDITFSGPTNQPVLPDKAAISAMLWFNASLGTSYSGSWTSPTVLRITITDSAGGSPLIGGVVVSVIGALKNAAATSLPSRALSGALAGDWGNLPGPSIVDAVADDPDDADGVYSNGDTLSIAFSSPTNRPACGTNAELHALLSFSHPMGNDIRGIWANASVLRITVVDAGTASPTLGTLSINISAARVLFNSDLTSLPSVPGGSVLAHGDWGLKPGPNITSFVADDPDDLDAIYGSADTLTITFSEPTNKPSVTNVASVVSFSQNPGIGVAAKWSADGRQMIVNVTNSLGCLPPVISVLAVTMLTSGNVRNLAGTSLPSVDQSDPVTGDWGLLAGPRIVDLVAADPDNADAVYGAGDTISIHFNMLTSKPVMLTKVDVDKVFSFSSSLGANYTGVWSQADICVITIMDPSGAIGLSAPAIGVLKVTVLSTGGLRNALKNSLPSTNVSAPIRGNWGNLPGPHITGFVAGDPDNSDALFSNGDVVTVTFSGPTNTPPVGTKALINDLFAFSPVTSLGTDYNGNWLSNSLLQIVVLDATGTAPAVGNFFASLKGNLLKNMAGNSLFSNATSGPLTGDWGSRAGPVIISFVASDPDNSDGVFGVGDTLTVTFSEATNTPAVATRANLVALLSDITGLGTDFTGEWKPNASTLVITIVNAAGATKPDIGSFTVTTVTPLLKNAAGTSQASASTSPALTGDWGRVAGPYITSMVAADPDNNDAVYSAFDSITITFSEATNHPAVGDALSLQALLSFNQGLGTAFGAWNGLYTTLTITVTDASGASPPEIGVLKATCKATGGLRNALESSLPSDAESPAITGNWGLLAGPLIASFTAADPDNADGVYGAGDTLTVCFAVPTNVPSVGDAFAVNSIFSFSTPLGTSYAGVWDGTGTCCAITVTNPGSSIGISAPKIKQLVVSVLPGGNLRNAAATSLPSAASSDPIIGNWGTLPGPQILSLEASDPDDGDAVYGAFDVVTVTFSVATDQPAATSGADLLALFNFTSPIGSSLSGKWISSSVLVINITSPAASAPTIGSYRIGVIGTLRDQLGMTLPSRAISPPLGGNWGRRRGPHVLYMTAGDPDDLDGIYSIGDALTLRFSEATSKPAVATRDQILSFLTFSPALGSGFWGEWIGTSGDTLVIHISNTSFSGPPTIPGLIVSTVVPPSILLKNSALTSLASNFSCSAINGTWGTKAGPNISSFVADDPDDRDAIFSVNDTLTITFTERTSRPPVATTTDINALLLFSPSIGVAYSGIWTSGGQVLTITLLDISATPAPQIGNLFVRLLASGVLRNESQTTLPSVSKSSGVSGDWGMKPGPSIVSLVAADPDNGDGIYSPGDTITVTFSEPTNTPAVAIKAALLALFQFSHSLGNDFTGSWTAPNTCVITVVDVLNSAPPAIGLLRIGVRSSGNLKNLAGTSIASTSISANITGTWGTLSGPTIIALVADDPDDGDAFYSVSDTISVVFSGPTNTPALATPTNIAKVFTFPFALGNSYSGAWPSPDVFRITLGDITGHTAAVFGTSTVAIAAGQSLFRNAAGNSLPCAGTSPSLSGDWGSLAGPQIVTLVADDPDDMDSVYGNGDTITVVFNIPTNRPRVAIASEIDLLLNFSESLGTDYRGSWSSDSTLLKITIFDNTWATPPAVGITRCQVVGRLLNQANTSLASTSLSPLLSGDFGVGPLCSFSDCTACAASSHCGWCASSKICMDGNASSPFYGSCSSGWEYGSCVACSALTTCASCMTKSAYCGWCSDTGCNRGNASSSYSLPCASFVHACPSLVLTPAPPLGPTAENGTSVSFTVQLSQQPAAGVSLTMASTNLAEGTVSPTSLSFTTVTWQAPTTVTLTGVPDHRVSGNGQYNVTFSPLSSTDLAFSGVATQPLVMTNLECDRAALLVACCTGTGATSEWGTTTQFTVALASIPSAPVTLALSSGLVSECTVSPATLSIGSANWNANQSVTVTGVDDSVADGTKLCPVTVTATSADPLYNGLSRTLQIQNADNDVAGCTVSPVGPYTTSEGGQSTSLSFVLNTLPLAAVAVSCHSSDPTEGIISVPSDLLFSTTSWNVPQSITVSGVDDPNADGDVNYTVTCTMTSSDTAYSTLSPLVLRFVNLDNDVAGWNIAADGYVTSEDGLQLVTITVSLKSAPTATVLLTATLSPGAEASFTTADALAFGVATWATPQQLVLRGVDDTLRDGDKNYTLSFASSSSDPAYNNKIPPGTPFSLTNRDDDYSGVRLRTASGIPVPPATAENGTSVVVWVRLMAPPTAQAIVSFACNSTEATVSPASLTFPVGPSAEQQVSVTGVQDCRDDGPVPYSLIATVSSTDSSYNGVSSSLSLVNEDDDTASLLVARISSESFTSDNGTTVIFNVTMGACPLQDVAVPWSSSSPSIVVVNPPTMTFSPTIWSIPQQLSVAGVVTFVDGGTASYTVTAGPLASSDVVWAGLTKSLTLNHVSNHRAALLVSPLSAITSESGGTASLSIRCGSKPSSSLSITASSSNTAEGTITTALPLVIDPANWNSSANVIVVTGVDDALPDRNVSYSVTVGPVTSTDVKYSGLSVLVSLVNVDNDLMGISLSPAAASTTEGGGNAVINVHLLSRPSSAVLVPVSSSRTDEVTCSVGFLSFDANTWATDQVVTITGVDDGYPDGNQVVEVVFGPASSADPAWTNAVVRLPVTNMDNENVGLEVSPMSGPTKTIPQTGAQFSVRLTSSLFPGEVVSIALSSTDPRYGSVTATSLTFSEATWSVPQVVVVIGNALGPTAPGVYAIHLALASSNPRSGYGNLVKFIPVLSGDQRIAGLLVSAPTQVFTSESGSSASFWVATSTPPLADVIVSLRSSLPSEGSCPPSVTIPRGTLVPQEIVVMGVDDNLADGNVSFTVSIGPCVSNDTGYNGMSGSSISFTNLDNDGRLLMVTPATSPLYTTSIGGTASVAVHLAVQPTADVTVSVVSSESAAGTPSPSSLTFTAATYATPQSVTVTGGNGGTYNVRYTLSFTVVSSDTTWSRQPAIVVPAVNLLYGGGDPFEVSLATANTSETGTCSKFVVSVHPAPSTFPIVLHVASSDPTEVIVSGTGSTLTFAAADWNLPREVEICGVPDDTVDGVQPVWITVGLSRRRAIPKQVSLYNVDVDTAKVLLFSSPTQTVFSGRQIDLALSLTSSPTAPVTISLALDSQFAAFISPSATSITFDGTNWQFLQHLILSGVVSEVLHQAGVVMLTFTSVSADPLYNGKQIVATVLYSDVPSPNVTSIYPTVAALNATSTIFQVAGAAFQQGASVTVGELSSPNVTWQSPTSVAFVGPSLHTPGYRNMTLLNPDGGTSSAQDAIYYTSDCPYVGMIGTGNDCSRCPVGAVCPGGNRIWPEAGYWTAAETSGYLRKCRPESRCLGGRSSSCAQGYSGLVCGSCADGFYSQGDKCVSCRSWWFYVVSAAFAFFLLTCCLAVLSIPAKHLVHIFWAILFCQVFIAVARMAPGHTPYFLLEAYWNMRFLAFDPGEFVRPGCLLLQDSAVQTFFVTLVVVVAFLVSFVIGPILYGYLSNTLEKFQKLSVRHLTIFASLTYYVVALRCFQAVSCYKVGPWGRSLLTAQLGQVCYHGGHIATVIIGYAVLLLYVVPLPVVIAVMLWRHEGKLDEALVSPHFGFFYEIFDTKSFLFSPVYLALMFVLAAVDGLLTPWRGAQFGICLAVCLLAILLLVWRRPFAVYWELILCCVAPGIAAFGSLINFLACFDSVPRALIWVLGIIQLVVIVAYVVSFGFFLVRQKIGDVKPLDLRHKTLVVYDSAGLSAVDADPTRQMMLSMTADISASPTTRGRHDPGQTLPSLRFSESLRPSDDLGRTKTAQQLISSIRPNSTDGRGLGNSGFGLSSDLGLARTSSLSASRAVEMDAFPLSRTRLSSTGSQRTLQTPERRPSQVRLAAAINDAGTPQRSTPPESPTQSSSRPRNSSQGSARPAASSSQLRASVATDGEPLRGSRTFAETAASPSREARPARPRNDQAPRRRKKRPSQRSTAGTATTTTTTSSSHQPEPSSFLDLYDQHAKSLRFDDQ